jgi:hypothetical protein
MSSQKIESNGIRFKRKNLYRLLFIGFSLILFYLIPKDYLGDKYPLCLYRILFGKKCLGCGTTRAVWSILHFRISDALVYNRLIIISFPVLVGCVVSWIFKSVKNNTKKRWSCRKYDE